ncbi:hypothetical protein LG311_10345 [Sutcliffiella horikoshii]|uniref:hypothetical protein n=1 Tax=Sutcliffiella horikoshii TaxID=79883 RepID=UPI00384B26BF
MQLSYFVPFITLIGVVIGFLLNWIKERYQNRAILKLSINVSGGYFNYYQTSQNDIGDTVEQILEPEHSTHLRYCKKIDLYNIGKVGTAIKSTRIRASANNYTWLFTPTVKIGNEENTNHSFNIPAGNIVTLEIKLVIQKNENTHFLFEKNSLVRDNPQKLKLEIIVTDIYEKKHTVSVDPEIFVPAR